MDHPIVEVYRRIYRGQLLETLRRELNRPRVKEVDDVLTRWILNRSDKSGGRRDPVFPVVDDDVIDEELEDYLLYRGFEATDIDRIHRLLSSETERIRSMLQDVSVAVSDRVSMREDGDVVRLRLELSKRDQRRMGRNARMLTVSIDRYYYDKLRNSLLLDVDRARERQLLFSLITRYETLGGDNYQSAVPPEMFELLRNRLGVTHETFASPINRHPGLSFTSLYPDIDGDYGSLGSYRDIHTLMNVDGPVAIQANPPFVESIMTRFNHLVIDILENRPWTTTVVIIIPSWTDNESYNTLLSSPFNRFHMNLLKDEHGYIVGSDYRRSSGNLISLCNTTIFIMSNDDIDVSGFEDDLGRSFI